MRQLVLGIIVGVWGAALVIAKLVGSAPSDGGGAYGAGQDAAWMFGVVMFVVGAFAIRNGLRARRAAG